MAVPGRAPGRHHRRRGPGTRRHDVVELAAVRVVVLKVVHPWQHSGDSNVEVLGPDALGGQWLLDQALIARVDNGSFVRRAGAGGVVAVLRRLHYQPRTGPELRHDSPPRDLLCRGYTVVEPVWWTGRFVDTHPDNAIACQAALQPRDGAHQMQLTDVQAVVLVMPGFEELEFWYPTLRLREAGAQVSVLGVESREVVSGRCNYPVAPDCALADYEGAPAVVVVPGSTGHSLDGLGEVVGHALWQWYESGARLVAISTGVGALALANLVSGATVSCPESVRSVGRETGGKVSESAVTVSQRLATARSVDYVAGLFHEVFHGALSGRS